MYVCWTMRISPIYCGREYLLSTLKILLLIENFQKTSQMDEPLGLNMEGKTESQDVDWFEVCLRRPPIATRNTCNKPGKAPQSDDPQSQGTRDAQTFSPRSFRLTMQTRVIWRPEWILISLAGTWILP